ncbi:unnamed protein product [Spirodela intermedia]|uniref:DYW domain-containing protein n=1 Tax=Spirodela intermedia TaxID=51605 RepID=A0A7I8L985_SPIIN|nr:unnamed protein product [Spirodela intermedia]
MAFFAEMRLAEVRPVVYNLTYLFKAAADRSNLRRGREIHAQLIANGFSGNVHAATAVVNLYAKCRRMVDARKVFDRMLERDLVAWNAVVAGYSQNGVAAEAVEMVAQLQAAGERPDSITIVAALPACADLGSLKAGKSIHAHSIRAGFSSLVNVATALVGMYSRCGALATARLVFERMRAKNVVSWNSMIDGYAQGGDAEEAMRLFEQMLAEGIKPTEVTIMAAVHACSDLQDLEMGKKLHKLVAELGLSSNVSVMNSLIAMYSRCRRVETAVEIFEGLRQRGTATLVSWNAMISGYAQNRRGGAALELFRMMVAQRNDAVQPDSFTLVSVIQAVAELSVLRHARWIHGCAARRHLLGNVYVATALVDTYAKCGGVPLARKVFDLAAEKHVTTWNAMIDGYGTHGLGRDALQAFDEMRSSSPTRPNEVTFLCVLSACSHSGLVPEGRRVFAAMEDYGLVPGKDHYSAMVDLLGRAGRLREAWEFIEAMPAVAGISVFGALLGACKIHRDVGMAEKAAERLFLLEPADGGYHVLLSNIYAAAGMWPEVARVRRDMERKALRKVPGWTSIEFKNEVHTFFSGDTNHPLKERIYAKLEELMEEIKAAGYVPDASSVHDVEADVQEQLLITHSEKLAIAFGLVSSAAGATIQIRKNLRVCADCHTATKFISLVTGREIIVRDVQRFHHFKDGRCSCGDYW